MTAPATPVPTRGERNNNPGNIVRGATPWLGLKPFAEQTDAKFCEFDTALHGIRALARLLLTYQRLDGCTTIEQMINRFAPWAENDTGAYLVDVIARTGFGATEALDLGDSATLIAIVTAIIHHENGRVIYDAALIADACHLAAAA